MSVDLRYVNPKISLFVDPGRTDKTERFDFSLSFINIKYCEEGRIYVRKVEYNPPDWWLVCLTLLQ